MEALAGYLSRHTTALQSHEARFRLGDQDAVHELRVATRRIGSALATYDLLLSEHADGPYVRGELRWLARSLGGARDAEVMRERLAEVVAASAPDPSVARALARVADDLTLDWQRGIEQAQSAVDSPRYLRLTASLGRLTDPACYVPAADRPAATILPRMLAARSARLRRAVRGIPAAEGPAARDRAMHEARKHAKRLRYAAECAGDSLGGRPQRLARRVARVQSALGDHHDSVVLRHWLGELDARVGLRGEGALSVERLMAVEEERSREAERAFRRVWSRVRTRRVRRWLERG